MDFDGGEQGQGEINEIEADFLTEQELESGGQIEPFVDEVIFLVHVTKELLQPQNDEVPLKVILQGFSSFVKSKIISKATDKAALIFFNSERTSNTLHFKGVEVVHALSFPSAEMIAKNSQLLNTLPTPASSSCALYEAFWICNHIFKETGSKVESSKRIFLFTTEDNPSGGDSSARAQAITHAKQLDETGVQIELFPIRMKGSLFNYENFYTEIIKLDPDEINSEITNPSDKLSDLSLRIRRREFKKRRLGRVDFKIGDGVIIGTQL